MQCASLLTTLNDPEDVHKLLGQQATHKAFRCCYFLVKVATRQDSDWSWLSHVAKSSTSRNSIEFMPSGRHCHLRITGNRGKLL